MRDDAMLREHYQRRFRHILVDEFQDTNRLQYLWLKMFAGPHTAVLAVGDDDQSIYAFRGAQVGNMSDFEREFRVKKVIKLEQNYRSYGNILDAANALIAHNSQRLGKNLRTERGPASRCGCRRTPATSTRPSGWWRSPAAAPRRHGRHEIAMLYRSNAQSRVIESALFNAGIPYRVYGGLRFFERAEIKHALAYLRLIENRHDDTSFLRVVNFPTRGIGARTLEQLQDAARQTGRSLWQSVGAVGGKGGANLAGFVR
jgi:DNA helicase-2/ATP-dependent DNA helicase PcrA